MSSSFRTCARSAAERSSPDQTGRYCLQVPTNWKAVSRKKTDRKQHRKGSSGKHISQCVSTAALFSPLFLLFIRKASGTDPSGIRILRADPRKDYRSEVRQDCGSYDPPSGFCRRRSGAGLCGCFPVPLPVRSCGRAAAAARRRICRSPSWRILHGCRYRACLPRRPPISWSGRSGPFPCRRKARGRPRCRRL